MLTCGHTTEQFNNEVLVALVGLIKGRITLECTVQLQKKNKEKSYI